MKRQVILSKNAAQTQKIAKRILGELLAEKKAKIAKVLALIGELGSGKTTFVQGLAKALGIKGWVTSPSFVIMRRYLITEPVDKKISNFYHMDCYRLSSPKELTVLGFKEIMKQPKNLVVIEWADKARRLIPNNAIWSKFEWVSEKERRITLDCKL